MHVTYVHIMAGKCEKASSRRKFVIKLSEDLLAQWMKKRQNVATLCRSTRPIICEILKSEQNIELPEQLEIKKRKVCAVLAMQLA
ncbi:hypothetical protein TNCT_194091 [Trichonephila clavata]|uniref:Uncharacterized protein n=1 Tax=Trichonephila clavata TaxID=2740835 RepID=A0A8X6GQY7_TRICU|nr:hypothetical protein TNCT_194091 [Trichonephila clavata]